MASPVPKSAVVKAEPAPAVTPNSINVVVLSQDGGQVHFKIRDTTPMSKLMNAYLERQGAQADNVRFLFDGIRLTETDTPRSLEMAEGDTIDAVLAQTGG